MLQALRDAMLEAGDTDQVIDQVSDQVKMLLEAIGNSELSGSELMNALGFSHRPTFKAVRWIICRVDSPLGNPPQLRLAVIGVVR